MGCRVWGVRCGVSGVGCAKDSGFDANPILKCFLASVCAVFNGV